jgi:hypothetical protein
MGIELNIAGVWRYSGGRLLIDRPYPLGGQGWDFVSHYLKKLFDTLLHSENRLRQFIRYSDVDSQIFDFVFDPVVQDLCNPSVSTPSTFPIS